MLELWLVRHAESIGNRDGSDSDAALTPEGREQARSLGPSLAGRNFDRVFSSPLLRARETAALALPNAKVEIEPRLRELVAPRERFVDVTRMSPAQMRAMLAKSTQETEVETGREFMARIRQWLGELPASGTMLVVTHYAAIREIHRAWIRGPAPQVIEPASITIVQR